MPAPPVPSRVLVCPQEFKGTLDPAAAAAALEAGVHRALPDASVRRLPMADGGPGTAELVATAAGGELVDVEVEGPAGHPLRARYALIRRAATPPLAVIESATAAGLVLVPRGLRDPARACSRGVGAQIRDALRRGAREIVVGVGGTGTNDGGAGAARGLGLRLLDLAGRDLAPGGIHLIHLAALEAAGLDPALAAARLRIAVDVSNPLLGVTGATAVYGPQKGVADWLAPALDQALQRWAATLERALGEPLADLPGAGAGGGLPVGLLGATRLARGSATIESGAALVAEHVGLRDGIAAADLVVTGEGRLDGQTAYGKTVGYVARLAAEAGIPCVAVAGSVEGRPDGVVDAESIVNDEIDEAAASARAAALAADAAERLVRRLTSSRPRP